MKPRARWRIRTLGSLIGIWLLLGLPAAATGSVSLSWDQNTEPDMAGYKVHIGNSSQTYSQTIDVGHVTTYTTSALSEGETYFFAVTAYDIFANESLLSNEVSAIIPLPTPAPEPEPTPTAEPTPAPEPEPTPIAEPTSIVCEYV